MHPVDGGELMLDYSTMLDGPAVGGGGGGVQKRQKRAPAAEKGNKRRRDTICDAAAAPRDSAGYDDPVRDGPVRDGGVRDGDGGDGQVAQPRMGYWVTDFNGARASSSDVTFQNAMNFYGRVL